MFWIYYYCLVFVISSGTTGTFGINHTNNNDGQDCILSEPLCLKCGPKGCIKCPNLIVHPSRHCVNTCPYGHRPRWSTHVDYMGRICIHNGNFLGIPSDIATILTGVLTGTILCLILIGSAAVYLRLRRAKQIPQNLETNSDLDESSPERKDFVKQLETLRPFADNFLDMLNDTRRQLRELHRNGDNNAIAAYKPVVRDLAKVLLLLNRKIDSKIAVPDDWEHLFSWAEKTLKRYKRMSDVSQPQVTQLINFLQGPIGTEGESRNATTMSTFKPDQVFGGSTLSLHNSFTCFDAPPINPQWKFEYSLVNNQIPTSEFNPQIWKNSKEFITSSLFLDDDFGQLGFRPQDEITTEL